jgi:hypothetical protein
VHVKVFPHIYEGALFFFYVEYVYYFLYCIVCIVKIWSLVC